MSIGVKYSDGHTAPLPCAEVALQVAPSFSVSLKTDATQCLLTLTVRAEGEVSAEAEGNGTWAVVKAEVRVAPASPRGSDRFA